MKNLMILDGNSIVNRAFYGIRMLTAPDGTPTNGIYGFLAILQRVLEEEQPDGLCVAFDRRAPTFRHVLYDGYKATRKGMPEELAQQMPVLREVLDSMGIRCYELDGYEADDLIGTVSRRCEANNWDCCVVTGDRDSLQLITDKTRVKLMKSRMGQTETVNFDHEHFITEYGFEPPVLVDLKALMGDASDNIPGVPGVGEKTAMDLLHRFGSLTGVYAHLENKEIKPGVRKKLAAGEESAKLSYTLATIDTAVPMEFQPEETQWNRAFRPNAYAVFHRLGFSRFIEKWGLKPDEATETAARSQLPLVSVDTSDALLQLAAQLPERERVAVLCEENLDAITLCDGETVWNLSRITTMDAYEAFLDVLFSERVSKVSHNVKDLMRILLQEGRSIAGFVFDTALADYLLEATEGDYAIDRLAQKYLDHVETPAEVIFCLQPILQERLQVLGMETLYYEIELPLCAVLAEMEQAGFAVDRQALSDFGIMLQSGITVLQQSIWEQAGEAFNINSPKQLGTILFEKLMLPAGKKTKTGWSTGAGVLEKLLGKHPIIADILEYRKLTKLKSTYADGLLKLIGTDGKIHTNFHMTVTATGRLSSTDPNLQNIPVRTELGREMRKMFVAAPGNVLVDADYSQIELRLLAHIADDKTMQEAFRQGEDIHTVTASQVFGVPLEAVTALQRSRAKAVNFGIVYGISAFSLAQDIGVYQNEAKAYIEAYLRHYSGVRSYMKDVVEQAKGDGYVTTLFGRRRDLPELKSSNFNLRSFGERVALNMPIQGTAADIIKLAMVHVHQRLQKEQLQAKLIMQVHDELIVECPEQEKAVVQAILTEEMQNAVSYSVPLLVDAHSGRSWYEAK